MHEIRIRQAAVSSGVYHDRIGLYIKYLNRYIN